ASEAGALPRRIDREPVEIKPAILAFRYSGARDLGGVDGDIDVAALDGCAEPAVVVGSDLAPQIANVGGERRPQDTVDAVVVGRQRLSEDEIHAGTLNKNARSRDRAFRIWLRQEAYAASCCSCGSAEGPESWPLAAVSRSTNSITAIGAMSPK